MKIKKAALAVIAAVLLFCVSLGVSAAPYQNYTVTSSGTYQEPQAYVPSRVYDTVAIGLENLEGIALNSPQDILRFKYNDYMILSDTNNNRLVVLDKDLVTVRQIIKGFDNKGKAEVFNGPTGLFIFEEEKLLYVCDTLNARIVRFVFDTTSNQFVFDKIFNDPGISEYLKDTAAATESGTATEAPAAVTETPMPTDSVQATAAPESTAPTATDSAQATAAPEASAPAATAGTSSSSSSSGGSAAEISYKPLKVVVDDAQRLFVVSKDCYQGLIELTSDGVFTKFYGTTKVKQSLSSLFNRIFSAETKSTLVQNLSTEYSSVTLDSEGFIYGTISSITAETLDAHFASPSEVGAALRKLNAAGSDVLLRQGFWPPSGDMGKSNDRSTYSAFVDVTVSDLGLSSCLDSNKGRVFTYSKTGELLYVFGALGTRTAAQLAEAREEQIGFTKGTSLSPVAVELLGDQETLVVLDSTGCQFTTFIATEYGRLIRNAVNYHETRQYDKAVETWNKVLGVSSNSTLAYSGIAKVIYMDASEEVDSSKQTQLYKNAAEYFKKAYQQESYAKAFYKYRDKVLEQWIPYLMTSIIVLAVAFLLLGWYKRFRSFVKRGGRRDV